MSCSSQDDLTELTQEFNASEIEMLKSKTIYDHFRKIILDNLENNLRVGDTEGGAPNGTPTNNKLRSSTSRHLGGPEDDKMACVSKTVEKRIHQLENYKNALKQSKMSADKLAFLHALNQ